jgi:thiosulfate reductase cytochrome b subunit
MSNLRLTLSQWFLGAGEGQALRLSTARRLTLLALFVLIGFGVVWLVLMLAEDLLAHMLASLAPLATAVLGEQLRFYSKGADIYFVQEHGRRFEAWVDSRQIMSNLPVLVTLLVVTPGMRWRRRLLCTLGAIGLAFVAYAFFLVIKVQIVLLQAHQVVAGPPSLWPALDDFFEIIGKTFFPIFIWLLFALPYLLGRVDRRAPKAVAVGQPSRNAPCPCGSGRKYKKCCGA